MAIFSKFYSESLKHATCRDIVHPDLSCWESALYFWTVPLPSVAKFFLPLLIIPLVVNGKRLDRRVIREILQDYGSAVMTTFVTGTVAMCLVCVIYHLLGGMTRYTVVAIPSFLGALNVFMSNEKVGKIFARSKLTIITEILIQDGGNFILKALRNSIPIRTMAFMTLSACLLDTLRVTPSDAFWFIRPLKSPNEIQGHDKIALDDNHGTCFHRGSCQKYHFEELKNILQIGLSIGAFQSIISNYKIISKQPTKLIATINYKLVAFIVGYPTIYRLSTCLLNRFLGPNSRINNATSGLLAGIPFYIYPELSIFGHTVTCVVETLWARYILSDIHKPWIIVKFSQLPLSKCFLCFGLGFIFHTRGFRPYLAPKLLMDLIGYCTNYKSDEFAINLTSFRMGLHWKNVKD